MSYIRLIFTLDLFGDKKQPMVSITPKRQPLYMQIKQLLLQRVSSGEWPQSEPLPSEWDLAEELSVSQGTVRKALTELVNQGVLYRQQGKGTFVADVASDWGEGCLLTPGLFGEAPDALLKEFLGLSRVNASEDMALALGVRRSAPVYRIRIVWRRLGVAVALDDVYLPVERFEGLEARWLKNANGVYAVLQHRYGVHIKIIKEQFRAEMLPREEAGLLGFSQEVPSLSMLRLAASVTGEVLEWRHRYCITQQLAYTV